MRTCTFQCIVEWCIHKLNIINKLNVSLNVSLNSVSDLSDTLELNESRGKR